MVRSEVAERYPAVVELFGSTIKLGQVVNRMYGNSGRNYASRSYTLGDLRAAVVVHLIHVAGIGASNGNGWRLLDAVLDAPWHSACVYVDMSGVNIAVRIPPDVAHELRG